jgi:hypothetical protein
MLSGAASLGFGALDEVVKFVAVLLIPNTNVGGYVNTGWDLVSNLFGGSRRGRRDQPSAYESIYPKSGASPLPCDLNCPYLPPNPPSLPGVFLFWCGSGRSSDD